MSKKHRGNSELRFCVVDPETRMSADFVSHDRLSVDKELVDFLESSYGLQYKIN